MIRPGWLTVWLLAVSIPGWAIASGQQFTLVLDPGHSPARPGALSAREVPEVRFNDALAARIQARLAEEGKIRVVLSRRPDEDLTLEARARRIMELDPDLVFSVHHDSVQPHYLTPWHDGGKKKKHCDRFAGHSLFVPTRGFHAGISLMVARTVAEGLDKAGHRFTRHHAEKIAGESRTWVDSERGIYAADFLYLARTLQVPFVLFEAGVIVNRDEETRLSDPSSVDSMAATIAGSLKKLIRRWDSDRRIRKPAGPKENDVAIRHPAGIPSMPVLRWQHPIPGLQVALSPVYYKGQYVDHLILVRAEPARFRVGVFFDKQMKTISAWQKNLGASVVINASFFGSDPIAPVTPILSNGKALGPRQYRSSHGAMLAEPVRAGLAQFAIEDYHGEEIHLSESGYREAVVSYPMLIDGTGRVRATDSPRWRADRSFVAIDERGRILLGTTEGGFFTLHRLGLFLKALPDLRLTRALNLDGGPPACMAVQAGNFEYVAAGRYASNDKTGREIIRAGAMEILWPLPGVIALFPREKPKP
jgi:N-acetylmuramoyl-L-alanine amidase